MTQIQKADPTSKALQTLITTAVIERVADQAIYSIPFKGRSEPVTGISAKGAEELYQQCVMQGLCPEMALLQTNDKVVDDVWICDGVWRATWHKTGETYTIDARGSQPNSDANANRIAFGKAKRNAHLSAVPSVIREAFLDHLTKHTGKRVVDNEEYAEREDRNPAQTARTSGRRQSTKAPQPHEVVYKHIADKWKASPAAYAMDIFNALGEKTLPSFLEDGTPEEAIRLIDQYWQNGGSTDPVVVTAVDGAEDDANVANEGEQAPLEEAE
jgi:hypothetical protein